MPAGFEVLPLLLDMPLMTFPMMPQVKGPFKTVFRPILLASVGRRPAAGRADRHRRSAIRPPRLASAEAVIRPAPSRKETS